MRVLATATYGRFPRPGGLLAMYVKIRGVNIYLVHLFAGEHKLRIDVVPHLVLSCVSLNCERV